MGRWSHDAPGQVVVELGAGGRTLYFAPQPGGSLIKHDLAGTTLLDPYHEQPAACGWDLRSRQGCFRCAGTFYPSPCGPFRGVS